MTLLFDEAAISAARNPLARRLRIFYWRKGFTDEDFRAYFSQYLQESNPTGPLSPEFLEQKCNEFLPKLRSDWVGYLDFEFLTRCIFDLSDAQYEDALCDRGPAEGLNFPWALAVDLFKLHIINRLMRTHDMPLAAALERQVASLKCYDPLIAEIMKSLITEYTSRLSSEDLSPQSEIGFGE